MKILVTGAGGYVGGSVAAHLANQGRDVSGLIRNDQHVEALKRLHIQPVLGNLEHVEAMSQLLSRYDAIIHCADSDHVGFVTLALEVLQGKDKIFIHTSGSSIVSERGQGMRVDRVHVESDFTHRPEKAGRVMIDRMVLAAANDSLRTAVICPSMIYGEGLGIKTESIQIPMLIDAAKKFGFGVHVGAGDNIWSNVHIQDLVKLFELVLDSNLSGELFFVENGSASLGDIVSNIHRLLGYSGEPRTIGIDQAIDLWGASAALFALASNSRISSHKAKSLLAWRPQFDQLLGSIHV